MKKIGTEIEKARKKLGISQKETAIALGISESYYTKIKTGIQTPSLKVARKIRQVLSVDLLA